MSTLTTLPDLCLLRIFDHLPPADLIALHLICSRFAALQSAACNRRQSLQLVVNRCLDTEPTNLFERTFFEIPYQAELDGERLQGVERDQIVNQMLQYELLDRTASRHLASLFPNVKHLKLAIKITYQHYQLARSSATNDLLALLTAWSPKLVTFNLNCHYDYHFYWDNMREHQGVNLEISRQLLSILEAVNSMSQLQSLALVFSNYFNLDSCPPVNLPILANLKDFYFFSYDQPKMVLQSLRRYGQNLVKIGINSEPYLHRKDYSKDFLELSPELAQKFTRISRAYYPFDEALFINFCNLTSLQIEQNFDLLDPLSVSELAEKLAPLDKLVHLRVHLIATHDRTLALDNEREPDDIYPLRSIRVLQLHLSGSSHCDVHSRHFGRIFPALEILQIQYYHWQCLPCRYDLRQATPLKTQVKCYQKAAGPWWNQCSRLKKVFAFAWAEGRYVAIEPKKEKVKTMAKLKSMVKKMLD